MESKECPAAAKNDHRAQAEPVTIPKKKNRSKNKRRFSDKQVELLESTFELETKLEPQRKLQLARELGLQPRQVAIWFQNKRARWRSKQIEQDYRVLKTEYDNLASQFESLQKERQSLLIQLQALNDQLEEAHCVNLDHDSTTKYTIVGTIDHRASDCEKKAIPNSSPELDQREVVLTHEFKSRDNVYAGDDTDDNSNLSNSIDCSLPTTEKWCSFDTESLFDQSCCSSNWWDIWT